MENVTTALSQAQPPAGDTQQLKQQLAQQPRSSLGDGDGTLSGTLSQLLKNPFFTAVRSPWCTETMLPD